MIFAKDINEKTPWQGLTPGGEIYEGGTSRLTLTGEWRSDRPVWLEDKCKQCLLCVPYCPDSAIPVKDGKRGEFDLMHCKGCGICAKVCPNQAIRVRESEGAWRISCSPILCMNCGVCEAVCLDGGVKGMRSVQMTNGKKYIARKIQARTCEGCGAAVKPDSDFALCLRCRAIAKKKK